MEVLGFPNGVCKVEGHGPKLAVGSDARCLKCDAAAQRATRTYIPVVTVQDPGKDAFDAHGRLKPGYVKHEGPVVQDIEVERPGIGSSVVHTSRVVCPTLTGISEAISHLPMPASLKQYKRLQKIKSLIDEAISEEENATDQHGH